MMLDVVFILMLVSLVFLYSAVIYYLTVLRLEMGMEALSDSKRCGRL